MVGTKTFFIAMITNRTLLFASSNSLSLSQSKYRYSDIRKSNRTKKRQIVSIHNLIPPEEIECTSISFYSIIVETVSELDF